MGLARYQSSYKLPNYHYKFITITLLDKRHDDWFLMSSPVSYLWTLLIVGAYYYFVKNLGPRLMEHRQPFELRRVLMAYNLFQIIFNGWMFYEIGMSGYFTGKYSLTCQAVDYSQVQ